jgi:ABC-2 type transport system permease protein
VSLLQSLTRILAFIGKDLIEVARRPGTLISLILGPVLIMVLFGLGYDGSGLRLRAVLVVPPESGLPTDLTAYSDIHATGGELVGVMTDPAAAERSLRDGSVDVVIHAPPDIQESFEAGRQSTIKLQYDLISPLRSEYAQLLAERVADEVNRKIIERSVASALSARPVPASSISPEIIASPTKAEADNLAPTTPSVTAFYGPAVLALIVQHTAMVLAALSMTRERRTGIFDLLRVSSVRSSEIVIGKTLAFATLVGLVSVAVLWLLGSVLAVPFLGDPRVVALTIALLGAASLGVGLLISVLSGSERQAVQVSLLLLLASVFLSGLILDLNLFMPVVQLIGALLPVTHGIELLQGILLRGEIREAWHLWALAVIAVLSFLFAWLALRRGMSARAP